MRYALIIILLFATTVFGQEEKLLELRDFKGLNTKSGDFALQPGEATIAHNVDFGLFSKSIVRRRGFELVSTLANMDSIFALFPGYYSDGTQQLFFVGDSTVTNATDGHGSIYKTQLNSSDISADSSDLVWKYWSIENPTSATQYKDNIYFVNGSQEIIVYNKQSGVARSLTTRAPGLPQIVPLLMSAVTISGAGSPPNDTSYQLTGEYRYTFRAKGFETNGTGSDTTVNILSGYMSPPLKIDNGRVLLADFPTIPLDTRLEDKTVILDSIVVYVYRTRNGEFNIDGLDTMWFVDSATIYEPVSGPISNVVMIDSLPDSTIINNAARLNSNDGFIIMVSDSVSRHVGRDSTATLKIESRYGAPTFDALVAQTSVNHGIFNLTSRAGIDSIYGVMYHVTYKDTITGLESDTSRGLAVYRDNANATFQKCTINLPKIPDGVNGLVMNIYRSLIIAASRDTSWIVDTSHIGSNCYIYQEPNGEKVKICYETGTGPNVQTALILDSIYILTPHLIATILDTSITTFTDELKNDTIWYNKSHFPAYEATTSPPIMSRLFVFQNRLFGISGSRLYYSHLDAVLLDENINRFEDWQYIPLSESDGDEATFAYPTHDVIRAFKNRKSFTLYETDDPLASSYSLNIGAFIATEISGHLGVVAPRSFQSGVNGNFYLSEQGVVIESAGKSLAKRFETPILSNKLDNFENMSLKKLSSAVGFYYPREQKYMLNIRDTTYIYDGKIDAWSTSSMSFTSACLYGVEGDVKFLPGDTMYFTQPASNKLHRYGGEGFSDPGGYPDMVWESGPLLISPSYKKINAIGLWTNAQNTVQNLSLTLKNHVGTSVFPTTVIDALHKRYKITSTGTEQGLYYKVRISSSDNWGILLAIDGIDVYYNPKQGIIERY